MIRIKSYNIPQSILGNKNKSLNHRLCLDWSCSTIHTVVTWHSKTFVNDLLSKILKKSIRVENDKTSPGKLFKVLSSSHSTYEVATSNIARFLFHVFSTCTVGLNLFFELQDSKFLDPNPNPDLCLLLVKKTQIK